MASRKFTGALIGVEEKTDSATFQFDGTKVTVQDINSLIKIIYDRIETVAFDGMIINKSSAFTRDETIMLYLDYVLIDDSGADLDELRLATIEYLKDPSKRPILAEFTLQVAGPRIVSTSDIQPTDKSYNLQITEERPLFWLRNNEEVDLTIFARVGNGKDDPKFRPVTVAFLEGPVDYHFPRIDASDSIKLTIETTGLLSPKEILNRAIKLIKVPIDEDLY